MSFQKKKILIVDDEYTSRRLLGSIIKNHFRCEILQADEGSSALRLMVKENPDLVILDMVMPFMNGVKVLQTMRKTSTLQHIPVIVCTSVGDDALVKKVMKYGIKNYIVKPINQKNAIEKIAKII